MTGCTGREVWRPVPDTGDRYDLSTHGRVRNARTGRVLKPWASDRGYLYVSLYPQRGVRVVRAVHVLVLEVYGAPRPAGHDVDHVDWNRRHNCVRNLRWLAYLQNHVRWAGRYSDGRIVWATPDTDPEERECSGEPLTPEQEAALLDDLALAGW